MKFDDVLRHVGEFGPYQQRLYVAICIPMAFHGIQVMSTVFTMAIPDHRCAIPGLINDTYSVQDTEHARLISQYIPSTSEGYSSCEIYDHTITGLTNSSDMLTAYNWSKPATIECDRWVYDTSVFFDTVITDTNLVCSKAIYRAHATTAIFVGGFVGLLVLGPVADRFGRKYVSYLLLVCMLMSSNMLLWLPNIYAFIVFRLLIGFSFGALFNLTFVYVMEFIGPSKRGTWGLCTNNFWGVGVLILSALAYGIRSWRHLQLALSLPILVPILYWWLIPESPRWLLVKGHKERGRGVLQKLARVNGVDLDKENIHTDAETDKPKSGCSNLVILFKYKTFAIRAFIIFWNWFVVSMLFYGVSLNVSNLSGDLYMNFFISAMMEVIGYTLCIPLMNRFGRKRYHVTLMCLGGVCLLLTIVPEYVGNKSTRWVATALSMVGKLIASAAYATVYVYSSELFPTVIRSTVMSISCNMASVGASMAPYVVELATMMEGNLGRVAPMVVFGATALSAGLVSLVLPETAGKNLPDNVEDIKDQERILTVRLCDPCAMKQHSTF